MKIVLQLSCYSFIVSIEASESAVMQSFKVISTRVQKPTTELAQLDNYLVYASLPTHTPTV